MGLRGINNFMGCISNGKITMIGNYARIQKKRPKNWSERDSKWIEPYSFKWRTKIGKLKCDCKEVLYTYMPYYGIDVYHSEECCLIKIIKERPQLRNLPAYQTLPLLARSE